MKRMLAMLVTGMIVIMSVTGCGSTEKSAAEIESIQPQETKAMQEKPASSEEADDDFTEKISFSTTFFSADNAWKEDEMYKALAEKFNVDIDFVGISWDNWSEKNRLWINSGDMPDVMFWDLNYQEYMDYADQGLIRALPDDLDKKYPNISHALKTTGVAEYLAEKNGGTLYTIPRAVNPFVETGNSADSFSFVYRKDWARQLGIEFDSVVSLEELLNLAEQFVQKDPGGNGAGKTIGFSGDPSRTCLGFLSPYNSNYGRFYKNEEGVYVSGMMEESTLEGVKALWRNYQDKLIDPNFFSNKLEDGLNKFYSGLSGISIENLTPQNYDQVITKFQEANPELDAKEAVGICAVTGADNKVHGYVADNYWSAILFRPDLDNKTMDRILRMMDYIASEEGVYFVNLGFEGKDYKLENGEPVMIRGANENGEIPVTASLYPSSEYFRFMTTCADGFSYISPSIPGYIREEAAGMLDKKEKAGTNLAANDLYIKFFDGPEFIMYSTNVDTIATEVILEAKSEEDVERLWNQKMVSLEEKTNKVLNELNAGIS